MIVKNNVVESTSSNGVCFIDLPLNSNQAFTHFEWKLKILQVGRYDTIENEIKVGISCGANEVYLSTKKGRLYGDENSIMRLNKEEVKTTSIGKITFKPDDILSFQFDTMAGSLFVKKNNGDRILMAYVKNLDSLRTNTFYPCVGFENNGDKIEILSAGPLHNSIHTALMESKPDLNRPSSYLFESVLALFVISVSYYFNLRHD